MTDSEMWMVFDHIQVLFSLLCSYRQNARLERLCLRRESCCTLPRPPYSIRIRIRGIVKLSVPKWMTWQDRETVDN